MGDERPSDQPNSNSDARSQQPRRQPQPRTNANHLLNFKHTSSRDARSTQTPHRRYATTSRSSRPQAYDRHKFLQVNFRFMVSDAVDIKKYERDADLMFEWEDIAAVELISGSPLVCPITLSTPLCPCITPCGHIFSAEAIISHMIVSSGGPELRHSSACPVCTTRIAARELRPVTVRFVKHIKTGDKITMKLLRRGRGNIIPHPVENNNNNNNNIGKAPNVAADLKNTSEAKTWSSTNNIESHGDGLECNPFAKFTSVENPMPLWASQAQLLGRKAAQLIAEGGLDVEYELPPVLATIDALAARAKAWTERRQRIVIDRLEDKGNSAEAAELQTPEQAGKEVLEALKRVAEQATADEEKLHNKAVKDRELEAEFPSLAVTSPTAASVAAFKDGGEEEQILFANPTGYSNSNQSTTIEKSTTKEEDDYFYIMQSADGQSFFLCPLNMKILVEWTGLYAAFPTEISAAIIELEEVEQNDATRKKLKMLSHLPLGSNFKLCEVDLREVLPSEALAPFENELAQRAKRRTQQAKQEARRQRQEAAKAAAQAAASAGPSAEELAAMPRLSSQPMPVPGSEPTDEEIAARMQEEEFGLSSPSPTTAAGPSFARIAKWGFAATGPALHEANFGSPPPPVNSTFPALGGGQSPTTATGVVNRGVWGAGSSPSTSTAPTGPPSWLAASTTSIPSSKEGSEKGTTNKKGKKGLVLFSTAQRRY